MMLNLEMKPVVTDGAMLMKTQRLPRPFRLVATRKRENKPSFNSATNSTTRKNLISIKMVIS